MNPKVSIVIPVYNGENYMREAIDSALAQTYENIEIIVVNDGSKDKTEEVALSYGNKIRYFWKKNGGVSTALNMGIAKMEGEYFQYLPHDDVLHPDKIRLQIEAIKQSGRKTTIAWSGWNKLMMPGYEKVLVQVSPWHSSKYWTKAVYPLFFGIVNTVTVLIHKNCLEEVGLFNESLYTSQDYDMWFRTFGRYGTVYLDEALVNYRFHPLQGTQADSTFENNCAELAWNVIQGMSEEEMDYSFSSKYMFYFSLLKYYKEMGWEKCYTYVRKKFMECDESVGEEEKKLQIKDLLKRDQKQLVLYGAGKNGQRLLRELNMYGIEVATFCDADTKKHGTEINGVKCISKEELNAMYEKKHTSLVITLDNPKAVQQEFMQNGFNMVMTYAELTDKLAEIHPVKEYVLQYL